MLYFLLSTQEEDQKVLRSKFPSTYHIMFHNLNSFHPIKISVPVRIRS